MDLLHAGTVAAEEDTAIAFWQFTLKMYHAASTWHTPIFKGEQLDYYEDKTRKKDIVWRDNEAFLRLQQVRVITSSAAVRHSYQHLI